jgi:hypothetical protein
MRIGRDEADQARRQLDSMIHPGLPVDHDKAFCMSAYPICAEYKIYLIDAMYLKVALEKRAALFS